MHTTERTPRETWAAIWPPTLAVLVVTAVGAPAAIASYRHARDVVAGTGDLVMAPWLPLSVDGMLVAALVVIWVRRHRGDDAGRGPWAAFLFGMAVTICANLAAVREPTVPAVAVALFPPVALAVTLELVALVAYRTRPGGLTPAVEPAVETTAAPEPETAPEQQPAPEPPAEPSPEPPAPTWQQVYDTLPGDTKTAKARAYTLTEWNAGREPSRKEIDRVVDGNTVGRDVIKQLKADGHLPPSERPRLVSAG